MRTLHQAGDALVLPDDEPILFVGPPTSLRAHLQLENTSDARMSLRALAVTAEVAPAAEAQVVAVLPAGSRSTATATLSVNRSTAPGSYPAQVQVGGQPRPARLVVLASTELDLVPGRVVVQAPSSTFPVVVRNDGNVAVPLAELVRADLRRDGRQGQEGDHTPTATARLAGPVRLEPGRSAVLELTVELPDDLDPTRRYVSELPLGPALLTVVVPPGAAAAPTQSTPPRKPAATPRRSPSDRRSR